MYNYDPLDISPDNWPLDCERPESLEERHQLVAKWRLEDAAAEVAAHKRYILGELEVFGIPPDQGEPVSERILRELIADSVIRSLLDYGDCDSLRADEFPGFMDFVKSTFGVDWQDLRPDRDSRRRCD